MALLALRDPLVRLVLLVLQAPQARQAQQVLLAQLDRQDQQLPLLLEPPLQVQQVVAPL